MPEKPRIIVVGSSNTDMVIKTDRIPAPGETVIGGDFIMVPGGKGANQAVAAARLGAEVTFIARIGTDIFGDQAVENFRKEGIDTRFIVRDREQPSGVALIFVDREGENVIVVAPGANSKLSPSDVACAADRLSGSSALVLQLEIPLGTVEHAARLAREMGVCVILNSAPIRYPTLPQSLLEKVDVLILNESEAQTLLGQRPDAELDRAAATQLLDLGIRCAIITLGGKGALVVIREGVETIPAPKVTPVDTTAAGDAFTGALTVALSAGSDLSESARYASKAAAISVTRMGAQSSLPTDREVEQFRED